MVQFYLKKNDIIRWVASPENAIQFVKEATAAGLTAEIRHNFAGYRMSSDRQRRMAYAVLRQAQQA